MQNNSVRIVILIIIIALGLFTFSEKEALAKGKIPILIIINTGNIIYPVAPIPPELAELSEDPDIEDWKLGYKCNRIGIFNANLWSWGNELVLYKGKTYSEIPPEIRQVLETDYPFSEAERSIWNRYGIVISVLIIVFLTAIGAMRGTGSQDNHSLNENDINNMQSRSEQFELANSGMEENDETKCPKCAHERKPTEIECPKCGIIYKKYKQYIAKNIIWENA
jgi:hypothetical protein